MHIPWQNQTHVVRVLQQCAELAAQVGANLRWYVLIDTAFDQGPGQHPFRAAARTFNCYHGQTQPLHDLATAAPCLVDCTVTQPEKTGVSLNLHLLEQALHHCSTRPMLSLLSSMRTPQQLIEQWRDLHMVRHAELGDYLLRIADTRRLPALARILTPAQWASWTQGIHQWHIIDRAGRLRSLPLPAPNVQAASAPLVLMDAQLDALEADAEADAYIGWLRDNMDDSLRPAGFTAYGLYRITRQAMDLADEFAIEAPPDKIALIVQAWSSRGHSNTSPTLRQLLAQKFWQTGQLGTYLADHDGERGAVLNTAQTSA